MAKQCMSQRLLLNLIVVLVVGIQLVVVVTGQLTAETGEFRRRNVPRDTETQDCSNRNLLLESVIQSIRDDVDALKGNQNLRIDFNGLNRNEYGKWH